jgi:NAD(P)-dependent dehydrogenase (short-subunit alcohol dehydrogenase family)
VQPELKRAALVLGGTGHVGSAVVAELARRGVAVTFTYWRSGERAETLAREHGARAVKLDLADAEATRRGLDALPEVPDVLVHCAGVTSPAPFVEIEPAAFQEAVAVNAQAPYLACQWLARRRAGQPTHVVLVGALDRGQSLPLPAHFAASQAMLGAMAMALAHELGPHGLRINCMALGLLGGGLSRHLPAARQKDYQTFSALRRQGTPAEAARAIAWLALEDDTVQGKVVAVNGGI